MEETNSPSAAHVGYDISPFLRVKFKILTTRLMACGLNFKFNSLEWRNIVTHGNWRRIYIYFMNLCISVMLYHVVIELYSMSCIAYE